MNIFKKYILWKHKRHVRNFKPKYVHNLWENQGGWGCNIYFTSVENRRLVGHHPKRNRWSVGNEVRCKMDSGEVARFEIVKYESANGVSDMFFCTLKDLDYLK